MEPCLGNKQHFLKWRSVERDEYNHLFRNVLSQSTNTQYGESDHGLVVTHKAKKLSVQYDHRDLSCGFDLPCTHVVTSDVSY